MRRTKGRIVLEGLAYHEAGHATMATLNFFNVQRLTLNPPQCHYDRSEPVCRKQAAHVVEVLQAGYVAHKLHEGSRATYFSCYLSGAGKDSKEIEECANRFGIDVTESERRVARRLRANWNLVETFAQMLLEKGEVEFV